MVWNPASHTQPHTNGLNPLPDAPYAAFCGNDIEPPLHCRQEIIPELMGLVYVPLKHPVHAADDTAPLPDKYVPAPHARHLLDPPSL